jgi:hypothetical protein
VVPELLAADPSYLLLPKVFMYVTRSAQHLLPLASLAPSHPGSGSSPASVAAAAGATGSTVAAGLFSVSGPPKGLVRARTGVARAGRGRRGAAQPSSFGGWLCTAAAVSPW